ncbi:MAG: type III-A CRISPR-associated RAMP protein Csm3 [Chitinophagales bacterium]
MSNYKLLKKIIIKGIIRTETGLHIGGTNSSMSIGGVDNAVIRNPLTNEPYIPGSSLKGKMRSLLELTYGTIGDTKMGAIENGPTEDPDAVAATLFGVIPKRDKEKDNNGRSRQRPSRILVRDAKLVQSSIDHNKTELPYTEMKTEVVIDRITSKAMPRQLERVPAGAEFHLNLVVNIFEGDKVEEVALLKHVFHALQLVQDDYIGGHGSRGSGQVVFEVTEVLEKTANYYKNGGKAENVTDRHRANFPE